MTQPTKVCFLDIDGPMIPMRAYYLPNQTPVVSVFDPCATSLLLNLLKLSGAKIVISSTWGLHGRSRCVELLEKNGISESHLHDDWITPRKLSSYRVHEIGWWLRDHPEITHYVAIDDEPLPVDMLPNSVLCDEYEGFSWRNYLECKHYLDAFEEVDMNRNSILSWTQYLKRREIWRTARSGEPIQGRLDTFADEVFPRVPNNDQN